MSDPLLPLKQFVWPGSKDPIWPVTLLSLRRNLARYPFPVKMDPQQMVQVEEALISLLGKTGELKGSSALSLAQLKPKERELIAEHFFRQGNLENAAAGQTLLLHPSGFYGAFINLEEQLELSLLSFDGNLPEGWDKLRKIAQQLEEQINLAFSTRFGYLTSDPSYCGTGLLITTYLHLPALVETGMLTKSLSEDGLDKVVPSSLEGAISEGSRWIGDLLLLSNKYTLGVSEEAILHDIQIATMRWVGLERSLRATLKEHDDLTVRDQINRALGLLTHSFQLEAKEALSSLSQIKLGIDLGLVQGMSDQEVTRLIISCRRGHIATLFSEEEGPTREQIHCKRAELLREKVAPLTMREHFEGGK